MILDPRLIDVPNATPIEVDVADIHTVSHATVPREIVTIDTSPKPVPPSIQQGMGERIVRKMIPPESRLLK